MTGTTDRPTALPARWPSGLTDEQADRLLAAVRSWGGELMAPRRPPTAGRSRPRPVRGPRSIRK